MNFFVMSGAILTIAYYLTIFLDLLVLLQTEWFTEVASNQNILTGVTIQLSIICILHGTSSQGTSNIRNYNY